MKKSKLAIVESYLVKLQEGNIYEPIKIEGVGVYRAILKRLETQRLMLVKVKDIELETAKRTSMSIASVAHDMKTPLAVIQGYAECIKDGIGDKDYPLLIMNKTAQMNDMVLELVDEYQQALNSANDEMTLHNARIYFAGALDRIKSVAETKGVNLRIKKIPNVPIRVKPKQFGRVVQNLITNAVKYSDPGSTITVKFKLWAKTLRISVKDRGIGIAKESLPFIFDQFYKEDKARPSTDSNGLGLFITKQIVESHGGTISVVSKKGQGSTFTVILPVEQELGKKNTVTSSFDRRPLWQKVMIEIFFGWIFASFYRICRFFESRNTSTFMFGMLCIALFPFVWIIDFLSVCVYGRITFLAE